VAWAWPLKAALWLALPLTAWQVGLISSAEKEYVRSLVRRLWGPKPPQSPPRAPRARGTPPPAETVSVEEEPAHMEWQEPQAELR